MNNMSLHLVFNSKTNHLKGFTPDKEPIKLTNGYGKQVDWLQMRENATRDDYGYYGECPPGEYKLMAPENVHASAFGDWYIGLIDYNGHWEQYNRSFIAIHGGGSGLSNSFKYPDQGWVITHGCLRMQNGDLANLVKTIRAAQKVGNVYLKVSNEDE